MTSALEGADVFCHYHPSEEQDAKDTADYIKKVAPNAKVETYAKDLRTEKACLEMVEEVKKWSGSKLDILYVLVSSPLLSLASPPLFFSALDALPTPNFIRQQSSSSYPLYDVGLKLTYRVNNAATQNEVPNIENLESEQWRHVSRSSLLT